MKTLSKMAAVPIVGALARGGAAALKGGVNFARSGGGNSFVGREVATRLKQKIPIVGAFAPETRLQQVQGVGSFMNQQRSGGVGSVQGARASVMPPPPQPPQPPQPMKMAYLTRAHDDMMALSKEAGIWDATKQALPGHIANVGLGALTIGGVVGAKKLYNKYETEKIWRRLKRDNPELAQSQADRENFEVLQRFSPDIAGNITTARSYLQRAQHTNMAPHEFVKDLAQINNARDQNSMARDLVGMANQGQSNLKYRELSRRGGP